MTYSSDAVSRKQKSAQQLNPLCVFAIALTSCLSTVLIRVTRACVDQWGEI